MKAKLSILTYKVFLTKEVDEEFYKFYHHQFQKYLMGIASKFAEIKEPAKYILLELPARILIFNNETSTIDQYDSIDEIGIPELIELHKNGVNNVPYESVDLLNPPYDNSNIKKVKLPGWADGAYITALCIGDWNGFEVPSITEDQIDLFNEYQIACNTEDFFIVLELQEDENLTISYDESREDDDELIEPEEINGIKYYDISCGLTWEEYQPNEE